MEKKIRVTVFNEFVHEQEYENIRKAYPDGIHGCIAAFLEEEADITVRTATFEMPEHGLSEEVGRHGCADLLEPRKAGRIFG